MPRASSLHLGILHLPAQDRMDEEQNDHRGGSQVSDAEQPGSSDAQHPQAEHFRRRQILLHGGQRPGSG